MNAAPQAEAGESNPAQREADQPAVAAPTVDSSFGTANFNTMTDRTNSYRLDRGEAVNLARNIVIEDVGAALTPKGQLTLAEAILKMDEELKRLYAQCDGPNYRQMIEDHNKQCADACDWKSKNPGHCAYRRPDGEYIYGKHRDCADCPRDWIIECDATSSKQDSEGGQS